MAEVVKNEGKRQTEINKSKELKHHKKHGEEANLVNESNWNEFIIGCG